MRSARDLLEELNSVDESIRIEAKRADEIGRSVMQSVSAFSNEPGLGGGYLLLGVSWYDNDVGDRVYQPEGLRDPDKVQMDLASQCASMFNQAIRPEMCVERLDGKAVLVVFVAEADANLKPIYVRSTALPKGAWRRIGSTDQRCTDEDLWALRETDEPRQSLDHAILNDARATDFDPQAIAEYRRLRERVNPQAEELRYSDEELLEALNATRRTDDTERPTVAGILLFGKAMALRRLLPAMRIDYMRISGTEWMEDPEQRFNSQDIRKPLLLALRQIEAAIVDDLPRGFRLPEGELQSEQEPILPRKVIREAIANAVMHRSYRIHEPIQVIRYSNRIEITNPGYSLKNPAELGEPGSRQRNPNIAAVLHDLNIAETKGTGVRTMRRLVTAAGLTPPDFTSDRSSDRFRAILRLHHLLTEDDHKWLNSLYPEPLSDDACKALIYARETGAVDNTACRELTGLDTLQASQLLRRLRDQGLLLKQSGGNRSHYTLTVENDTKLGDEPTKLGDEPTKPDTQPTKLVDASTSSGEHNELPAELRDRVHAAAGRRLRESELRRLIHDLCGHGPYTAEQLEYLLGRSRKYLMNQHIRPMVRAGELIMRYPETAKHPRQAYTVPGDDKPADR